MKYRILNLDPIMPERAEEEFHKFIVARVGDELLYASRRCHEDDRHKDIAAENGIYDKESIIGGGRVLFLPPESHWKPNTVLIGFFSSDFGAIPNSTLRAFGLEEGYRSLGADVCAFEYDSSARED